TEQLRQHSTQHQNTQHSSRLRCASYTAGHTDDSMGRDLTAIFISSLVLLLCPGPDAFVPSARIRPPLSTEPPRHRVEGLPLTRRTRPSLPCTHSSAQQQADNGHGSSEHDDDDVRSTPQRRPPPAANGPASVVRFRVLRGGNPRDDAAAAAAAAPITPEADLVEVSLDRPDSGGGMANNPHDLREFLFLVRSSQPGSIGEDLQRRGVRVFPEEAFVDAEAGFG
ncbi:unnamed protein product, partial [Ectocarpus sp. 12 AP-2014]